MKWTGMPPPLNKKNKTDSHDDKTFCHKVLDKIFWGSGGGPLGKRPKITDKRNFLMGYHVLLCSFKNVVEKIPFAKSCNRFL